jgi:hypothetical protein
MMSLNALSTFPRCCEGSGQSVLEFENKLDVDIKRLRPAAKAREQPASAPPSKKSTQLTCAKARASAGSCRCMSGAANTGSSASQPR